MRWETVTSTIGHSVYALWNNGRKLLTLAFHPASSAARIEFANEKRVFLIRKEGFLKNKTVLRNEYGMLIGHAGTENHENFFEMNDERFFYSLGNKTEPSLTIYKESKDRPLAICSLDEQQNNMLRQMKDNKPLEDKAHYSLLMGLCWYLFQPSVKENRLEFTI